MQVLFGFILSHLNLKTTWPVSWDSGKFVASFPKSSSKPDECSPPNSFFQLHGILHLSFLVSSWQVPSRKPTPQSLLLGIHGPQRHSSQSEPFFLTLSAQKNRQSFQTHKNDAFSFLIIYSEPLKAACLSSPKIGWRALLGLQVSTSSNDCMAGLFGEPFGVAFLLGLRANEPKGTQLASCLWQN